MHSKRIAPLQWSYALAAEPTNASARILVRIPSGAKGYPLKSVRRLRTAASLRLLTEEEWSAAQRPKLRLTRRQFPPLLAQRIASCARCNGPLYPARPLRGPKHPGEHYAYYREPSKDFHRDCPDAGLLWPSDEPDRILAASSLTMPAEWLAYVRDEAARMPDGVEHRRAELKESLHRLQMEYVNGRLDGDEYDELRRPFEDELAFLPARRLDVVRAITQFESFGELWDSGSPEARNDACQVVFDAIVLDLRERRIVEARVAPEFEPLVQLRSALYVGDTLPGRASP